MNKKIFLRRLYSVLTLTVVSALTASLVHWATTPEDDIPLPFGDSGTESLAGQLVTLGQKRGVTVRHVSFDADEVREVLREEEEMNSMDFIVTPDSPTISHGAQLCQALTAGKKYFGYKYTSRAADDEKDARDAAINLGAPSTLQVLFPGEFFASAEMPRGTDSFIKIFEDGVNEGLAEGETPFSFRDSCDVTL
ncbi:MAG: hypothetical protein KBC47_03975, partial [Candidatus Peribacteraceae bacterium]|nr:hypothetical protein [Candidatus Peribacteraceae bacterium]